MLFEPTVAPDRLAALQGRLAPRLAAADPDLTAELARRLLEDCGFPVNGLRVRTVRTAAGPRKEIAGDVATRPPDTLPPDLAAALARPGLAAAWRDEIARRETRGLADPWGAIVIDGSGIAHGRYQMRKPALQEARMMDGQGGWTGRYGVHRARDFLDGHAAQDAALDDYVAVLERRDLGLALGAGLRIRDLLGRRLVGINEKAAPDGFEITRGGVIAAMHRIGQGPVRRYLRWLVAARDGADALVSRGRRAEMTSEHLAVETRLRQFAAIPLRTAGEEPAPHPAFEEQTG